MDDLSTLRINALAEEALLVLWLIALFLAPDFGWWRIICSLGAAFALMGLIACFVDRIKVSVREERADG